MAAPHRARRLLRNAEEEARADDCFSQGGARPRLPHQRPGKRMKSSFHDASARQRSGGPSPVLGRGSDRNSRTRNTDIAEVERQIAGLFDRSTQDLRVAWREWHRTGPPQGLSPHPLIRALADQLQERTHRGTGRALQRRLQNLTASRKAGVPRDPGIVLKTGTRLVRHWRGHAHTVLVQEDGFEYEGHHYRSLTVIAERITGAHWSGPRFFGLTKRAGAAVGAEAGRGHRRPAAMCGTQEFVVRSTPANLPRRGSIRNSIRCRRSAKPARRSSTANGTRAGCPCPRLLTTAGSPARRWSGRP